MAWSGKERHKYSERYRIVSYAKSQVYPMFLAFKEINEMKESEAVNMIFHQFFTSMNEADKERLRRYISEKNRVLFQEEEK